MLWCGLLAALGAFIVWGKPRAYIAGLVIASVVVEVIHHWYAGIGQYFPWVGVWLGGIVSAKRETWREWWRFLRRQAAWIAVFLVYLAGIAASALAGIHLSVSVRYALGVPAVLAVAVIIFPWAVSKGYSSLASVFRIIAGMGVVLTVSAAIAALGYHSGFPVPVGHHTILAWQWPFANKNTFGMLLTFAFPAAAFLTMSAQEDVWARTGWGVASLVLLVGVALSYSRSSWIASLVGLVAFVVLYYGRRGALWLAAAIVVMGGGLVAKTGIHKWQLLWSKGLNGRIVLWKAGFRAMDHHWVLGVGPGNSPMALRPFVPAIYAGLTPSDSLLRTGLELGLLGLALWLVLVGVAMVGLLLKRPWGHWQDSALFAILLASLAQQVVESLMLGGVSFGDFFFTLFVGLAWYRVMTQPANRRTRRSRLRPVGR